MNAQISLRDNAALRLRATPLLLARAIYYCINICIACSTKPVAHGGIYCNAFLLDCNGSRLKTASHFSAQHMYAVSRRALTPSARCRRLGNARIRAFADSTFSPSAAHITRWRAMALARASRGGATFFMLLYAPRSKASMAWWQLSPLQLLARQRGLQDRFSASSPSNLTMAEQQDA